MRTFFRILITEPTGDGDPRFYHVMRSLGILTFLCFALASAALIANYFTAASISQDRKTTWHAVVCQIEKNAIANPVITYDQTKQEVDVLDSILVHQVHAAPCGLKIPRPH